MPPKRRGAQAKSATKPAPPEPPKPPKPLPSSKSVPAPPAPAPPPPPQPVETDAARVRKEWSKFIDAWYEPHRNKLVEKLQKDIFVKYKDLGSPKDTQKLREMELFEKLDSIAEQLTQPARAEWERRLAFAQLREDQWDDMSAEEQQAVMGVFVGFFADDIEDMDDLSADPSSIEEEESIVEEPPYRGIPSYPPASSRQPIPPTPTKQAFEFVHPTSFFAESMTPPNPTKKLPALSMDHLATLGPSNAGRSAEPVSANVNGVPGFQNWASEAGIVTQLPQAQSAKPPSASTSAQSLSARPRATDNMSRQASAASSSSSPPLKISSPQYSPPIPTTKFSPPINAENLPLGKRYIGPVIEEELGPMDEELLKSKMADEYQQYKISLRIQMIYQFHAEAAEVEIKLFETLMAGKGTKESRARAVQEHETTMMRLREQKEEERKRLCAEEREKRRQEISQHLAQRRSPQNREVDPGAKANPPKPLPDKTSVQQRSGKGTHQKENVPLPQPAAASSKLELPSGIKKSNSSLSQGEASANEALFASAMAMMTQGKAGATGLTPTQASLNEALFSNAAAVLATQNQPGSSGKSTVQPPSIMKKSNSSRSQDQDIPQITVSFAEPLTASPEPTQAPPATVKGKKGKKGQPTPQLPPAKTVAITEEPEMEMDAEPPPVPSLWDAASVAAKNVWSVASTSIPTSKAKLNASAEDERDPVPIPTTAPAPSKGNVNAKKTVTSAKKGKTVTITEEPDVDADPIVSPPPSVKTKATKGAWGSVNGKSKATPPVAEESELEHSTPLPPVTSVRGKKIAEAAAKSGLKPQLKVAISEEQESGFERIHAPARANKSKSKSTWEVPAATSSASTSTQAGKKATQQQVDLRRSAATSGFKSVRVETVPDPDHEWPETANTMPGALGSVGSEEAEQEEEEEEEGDATAWFNPEDISYWANLAGQSEVETHDVPQATEQTGKHVRWTPTAGGESEDEEEFGEAEDELAASMWMQYAISGGDMPTLGGAPEEPQVMPSEIAQRETSLWEQGRGKKKLNPTAGDFGSRVQQTSVFDRAALTGQWPKMESWLAPPSRGQSSGSTRVF